MEKCCRSVDGKAVKIEVFHEAIHAGPGRHQGEDEKHEGNNPLRTRFFLRWAIPHHGPRSQIFAIMI